jgi:large subunit ribosomal protein L15
MIGLNNLKPKIGSRHKKKIVGRGEGSGHGGTATRGMKGQKARSGDGYMTGFEGGQMPMVRRIPKRGFNNKNYHQVFEVINIDTLDKYCDAGKEITKQVLKEKGLISGKYPVKILGNGETKKALIIKAASFSKSAIDKVKAAGGTTEIVKSLEKVKNKI